MARYPSGARVNKHRRARDLATQLQALTGQHIAIRDGKRSSPTPPPDPKPTAAQHDPAPPGAFGLPTHHPIFGSELPLLAIRFPMVFVEAVRSAQRGAEVTGTAQALPCSRSSTVSPLFFSPKM